MNLQVFVRRLLMRALWKALESAAKAGYAKQPDRDPAYFEPSTWDGHRDAETPVDR